MVALLNYAEKKGVAPLRELLYIVHYFHEWNEHRVTKSMVIQLYL